MQQVSAKGFLPGCGTTSTDQALAAVAEAIRDSLRDGDLGARMAGTNSCWSSATWPPTTAA